MSTIRLRALALPAFIALAIASSAGAVPQSAPRAAPPAANNKPSEQKRLMLREMADELAAEEKEVEALRAELLRLHALGHIVDPDMNSANSVVKLHPEAKVPDKQAATNDYIEAKANWLAANALLRAIRLRYQKIAVELGASLPPQ